MMTAAHWWLVVPGAVLVMLQIMASTLIDALRGIEYDEDDGYPDSRGG
jgi:ABC-type dipeptide/oligopeptide/nickel transport system permease subunit